MAATLDAVIEEIRGYSETRPRERLHETPRVAHDRDGHAQGLDRPQGSRRHADRRHVPRAPGAADRARDQARASEDAGNVDAQLPARGAIRRHRPARFRNSGLWRPRERGAWAAIRTPTAGCCCASCACPISANMPCPCRRPASKPPKPRARWDECCATSSNSMPDNFRIFGPDETASNRLDAVFEVTNRTSEAAILPSDDHVAPDGRVMEVLSEHMCQGWLEGYLLTGRHGFFSCYEAFIHIIDSMFNQHAKWLKVTRHIPWRPPIASLNYLLTSHVWRQDHNGFSHQDPGLHRSRGQQEGGSGARVSAARRQHAAVGGRPLPAQPALRQRDRRREAAGAAVARYGRRRRALHRGSRHLAVGQHRRAKPNPMW